MVASRKGPGGETGVEPPEEAGPGHTAAGLLMETPPTPQRADGRHLLDKVEDEPLQRVVVGLRQVLQDGVDGTQLLLLLWQLWGGPRASASCRPGPDTSPGAGAGVGGAGTGVWQGAGPRRGAPAPGQLLGALRFLGRASPPGHRVWCQPRPWPPARPRRCCGGTHPRLGGSRRTGRRS